MIIFLITTGGLLFIRRFDKDLLGRSASGGNRPGGLSDRLSVRRRKYETPKYWNRWTLAALCAANDILIWFFAAENIIFIEKHSPTENGSPIGLYLALSLLAGCLMISCITDLLTFQVYNFVWWIGGLGVGGMLLSTKEHGSAAALLLFCFLQQFFFSRMYGRADCHAFCVCAAAECALGMGMLEYLVHMLLAYILLAVVQGAGRNISRKGNLKVPAAFLPYIVLSFWIHLLLYSCGILPQNL